MSWCVSLWVNLNYSECKELLGRLHSSVLSSNLGCFQPLFLQIFSLLALQYVCCSTWLYPTGLLDSVHFSSVCLICSLFFNLFSVPQTWSFSWSYLHVCWLFVLPIHICLWIYWFFHFSYCTFQLQNVYLFSSIIALY